MLLVAPVVPVGRGDGDPLPDGLLLPAMLGNFVGIGVGLVFLTEGFKVGLALFLPLGDVSEAWPLVGMIVT